MSYLASSPITLNSVPLQIKDNGFSVSGVTVIDDGDTWLSRSRLAALRDADDALGFDMVSLTGARTRIDYVGTGHTVPANNEANLAVLYRKILRQKINLSGTTMNATDYSTLYGLYNTAQIYWAKRNQILAQIGDDDITYDKVILKAAELVALTKQSINFVSPLLSVSVSFAEGASCSFSAYVENIVSDFNFELVYDTILT